MLLQQNALLTFCSICQRIARRCSDDY